MKALIACAVVSLAGVGMSWGGESSGLVERAVEVDLARPLAMEMAVGAIESVGGVLEQDGGRLVLMLERWELTPPIDGVCYRDFGNEAAVWASTPEPSPLLLLLVGLTGFALRRRYAFRAGAGS